MTVPFNRYQNGRVHSSATKVFRMILFINILMSNHVASGQFVSDVATNLSVPGSGTGAIDTSEMPDMGMSEMPDMDMSEPGTDAIDTSEMPEIGMSEAFQTAVEQFNKDSTEMPAFMVDSELQSALQCVSGIHTFDNRRHKRKYKVAVQALRGFDTAFAEYNKTFGEYLSMAAGHRFDPPIEFEMVPVQNFEGILQDGIDVDGFDEIKDLDFFYASPAVFSCIGTEIGAQPLATAISRLTARGHTYDLDVYGGVIMVHKDNDHINTIADLKDKIIGAGSISTLMAGQLQFYEMERAGLSYVKDPKQVVFTENEFAVVRGVHDGEFDVGFVRTDVIERTDDRNGNRINPDMFKIIEPKIHIMNDGTLFPFLHSTPIYPEWPLASLTHLSMDVTEEVQTALLAMEKHAEIGRLYEECIEEYGMEHCDSMSFPEDFMPGARCDTTKELALLAREATKLGSLTGFRTTGSYAELRSMQETAGFLLKDERGNWRCTRSTNLYDELKCPEGHFKRSKKAFDGGCAEVGLSCKEGYECFCKPCVEADELDVYRFDLGTEDARLVDAFYGKTQSSCGKMNVCGVTQQTKPLTFRIYDNMEIGNRNVTVTSRASDVEVAKIPNTFAYQFNLSSNMVGYDIIEIFAEGEQIKGSPILMQVVERDCAIDYPGEARVADFYGQCVCKNTAMEIKGRCFSNAIVSSIIAMILFLTALQIGFIYLRHKKREADTLWLVNVDELHFSEPVEVIGQGSFGVVLLAEYRGTKVAVKRVLPPREQKKGSGGSDSKVATDDNVGETSKEGFDIEAQANEESTNEFLDSVDNTATGTMRSWSLSFNKNKSKWAKLFPGLFDNDEMEFGTTNILMSKSFGSGSTGRLGYYFKCFDTSNQQKKDFMAEMRLLSRLRHPCITTVMGAVISPVVEPMLVMEYMEYGSLYDLLRNETMFTGGEVLLPIIRDIAQGLRYLHASKPPILHGDLKAKNILVDSRFRAKVGDFGLSIKKSNGIHGTPYWMAPEYLRRKSEYNEKCDIYSLGMVLYEMYARKSPYEGENPRRVLRRVCNPRINMRPELPEICPPKMGDIIKKCWSPDHTLRPTARDLDLLFMDMSMRDVEPQSREHKGMQQGLRTDAREERTSKEVLYDVFPKHIADALNAGRKVEPETHEMVTVVFSDIVGFTTISREISPLKVSNMLDRLYLAFDGLARKHEVFKVETIGDAYMGVTNLNESQADDHTKRIAEFGLDLIEAAGKIAVDEENPDKGFINVRVGFHSGPVVSNVIGSLNPRYGLFGDTVNTASRMETNSSANRILCSEAAAALLNKQARDIPMRKRGKIGVKGRGSMVTYWVGDFDEKEFVVEPNKANDKHVVFEEEEEKKRPEFERTASRDDSTINTMEPETHDVEVVDADNLLNRTVDTSSAAHEPDRSLSSLHSMQPDEEDIEAVDSDGLADRVVEVLSENIQKIVAVRKATTPVTNKAILNESIIHTPQNTACIDEVSDIIRMPNFNPVAAAAMRHHKLIEISPSIKRELKEFVMLIKSGYRNNYFHNFEHSSHVTVSLHKLLQRILTPFNSKDEEKHSQEEKGERENEAELLHDISYGISSDPMALFALVFSAFIHDVDHRGLSNVQLIKEEPIMASRFKNKSIAEQNSVNIAWEILMFDQFAEMRKFIFGSQVELLRFRQMVVNIVMATDIFEKESNALRKQRWQRAFGEESISKKSDNNKDLKNLRASLVLEQIIQAADVSHTMQHWTVYQKWNKQLFHEMLGAHRKGLLGANPSNFWYQGELNFLDSYIIPMAIRLKECDLLGVKRDDFINYAIANRAKWALCGKEMVAQMEETFEEEKTDLVIA